MIRTPKGSSAVLLKPRTITLSGSTKTFIGDPLSRRVIVYKNNNETTVVGSATSSAINGVFFISVNAGPNDYFRVIALPDRSVSSENARIFDLVNELN